MTGLTEHKHRILEALRHQPLNMYAIAGALDLPPYLIRAELKALRRERLVTDLLTKEGHLWDLTDKGRQVVWNGRQQELFR